MKQYGRQDEIITQTAHFVKETLASAEGGHDWWHIHRVRQSAKYIAQEEGANIFVVELGALLHDIADAKFHNGDEEIGPRKARTFLQSLQVDADSINHVEQIVRHISFRKGSQPTVCSLEFKIVQDADRLDALGAIGIARAFNYGGFMHRPLHVPDDVKHDEQTTLQHFYDKLLLLKERMHTATAQKIAAERHAYMEQFIEQFFKEWKEMSRDEDGKKETSHCQIV